MHKRTIVISLSAVAIAATTGGAYAATRSSSSPRPMVRVAFARPGFTISEQRLISDAARRLNMSPSRLTAAFKQALIDQINAEVKATHLSPAQASAIKKQIEHGPGLPFGPGLLGPGLPFGPGLPGAARLAPAPPCPRANACQVVAAPAPFLGGPAVLPTAAHYLGLSLAQLAAQLRSGKTLAQIAQARGKSTSGLEQAIIGAFKSELEKSFAAQRAMEQRFLAGLPKLVDAMVNSKGPIGPLAMKGNLRFAGPPPIAWSLGLMPPPVVRTYTAPQRH